MQNFRTYLLQNRPESSIFSILSVYFESFLNGHDFQPTINSVEDTMDSKASYMPIIKLLRPGTNGHV